MRDVFLVPNPATPSFRGLRTGPPRFGRTRRSPRPGPRPVAPHGSDGGARGGLACVFQSHGVYCMRFVDVCSCPEVDVRSCCGPKASHTMLKNHSACSFPRSRSWRMPHEHSTSVKQENTNLGHTASHDCRYPLRFFPRADES